LRNIASRTDEGSDTLMLLEGHETVGGKGPAYQEKKVCFKEKILCLSSEDRPLF